LIMLLGAVFHLQKIEQARKTRKKKKK